MRAWLVFLLLVSATAHAENVGVVVTGEAMEQPQVRAGIEMWLRDHGHTVVGSPLLPDATNKLIDCFVIEDAACAKTVVEQSTAPAILFARVDVTDTSGGKTGRDFALAGTWLVKGADPITVRRTCHHCSEEGMRETLVALLGSLVADPAPAPAASPAAVPPSAPSPAAATVVAEAPPPNYVPYAVIGGGGALLVTGLVLIALDQSPDPHGAQSMTLRDTETAGIVLSLVGVAAAGAGGYLWWRDHHGGAPVAAVTHDAALVGWSGRF